jgi:hypothetical protein
MVFRRRDPLVDVEPTPVDNEINPPVVPVAEVVSPATT